MKIRKSKSESNVHTVEYAKGKLVKDLQFYLQQCSNDSDTIELVSDIMLIYRDRFTTHESLVNNINKIVHTLSIPMLEYILSILIKKILS